MQQFFWTQSEKTKVIKQLVAKIKEDLRRDEKEGLSAGLVKGSQLSMLDIIFCKMQLDNSSRKSHFSDDIAEEIHDTLNMVCIDHCQS